MLGWGMDEVLPILWEQGECLYDLCLCLGCGGVGGVGREWVGCLDLGLEWGWCYVCVSCVFGLSV